MTTNAIIPGWNVNTTASPKMARWVFQLINQASETFDPSVSADVNFHRMMALAAGFKKAGLFISFRVSPGSTGQVSGKPQTISIWQNQKLIISFAEVQPVIA